MQFVIYEIHLISYHISLEMFWYFGDMLQMPAYKISLTYKDGLRPIKSSNAIVSTYPCMIDND